MSTFVAGSDFYPWAALRVQGWFGQSVWRRDITNLCSSTTSYTPVAKHYNRQEPVIKLFFSYSHKDEQLRDELEIHLAMLKRQKVLSAWHDRRIGAGADIDSTVSQHLEEADVILLLVSPYFLASDYCYDVEMRRALERHEDGSATVIPVILEPCDWHPAPFGGLRATPTDGKPVTKFANQHDAFLEIVRDIRGAATTHPDSGTPSPQDTTPRAVPVVDPARSSNLRLRKAFTDHERDQFVDESFTYIRRYFENSLEELRRRNPGIETRFRETGHTGFTAAVYVEGTKKASCKIWQPDRNAFGGAIAYSNNEGAHAGSYNDSMGVADDGYSLGLQPLGFFRGGRNEEMLSPQGAAEYFWAEFVGPLQ